MSNKTDITVLTLRFIFGAILGGLLTGLIVMMVIWLGDPQLINIILMIGGVITLLVAIFATIWGDRFIVGVTKLFRIFKYFP
jgi:hypothetical protein